MSGAAIVIEARTWIGTRFAHQGRAKRDAHFNGAVDCLGLLIGVAEALDLRDKYFAPLTTHDKQDYTRCPDGKTLERALHHALHPVPSASIQAGDIALFTMEGNPQHVGIITDYNSDAIGLIHAYAPARAVVEHVLDASWRERMIAAFRVEL